VQTFADVMSISRYRGISGLLPHRLHFDLSQKLGVGLFLVEHDVPVAAIKQWLGHGSEQMIRRYTHHPPEYHSAILAKIPSIFSVQNEPKPGLLVPNSPKTEVEQKEKIA
jgi:hypothetical protein